MSRAGDILDLLPATTPELAAILGTTVAVVNADLCSLRERGKAFRTRLKGKRHGRRGPQPYIWEKFVDKQNQHTQGKLIVSSTCPALGVMDEFRNYVRVADCTVLAKRAEVNMANARRIAACWNLLQGFSTEEIEKGRIAVVNLDAKPTVNVVTPGGRNYTADSLSGD